MIDLSAVVEKFTASGLTIETKHSVSRDIHTSLRSIVVAY